MSNPSGRDDRRRRPTTTATDTAEDVSAGRKKQKTASSTGTDRTIEHASRDDALESATDRLSSAPPPPPPSSAPTEAAQSDDVARRSVTGGDGQDEQVEDECKADTAVAVDNRTRSVGAGDEGDKNEKDGDAAAVDDDGTGKTKDGDTADGGSKKEETRKKATPEQRAKAAAARVARAKKKAKPHVRKKPQRPVTRDEIEPDVADRQPLGCYVLFDSRFLAEPRVGGTRNFARHMRSPELVRELRRAASHARETANERSRSVQHKLVHDSAVGGGCALTPDDARPLVFVANGFVCERDLDQFRWRLAHEYSPHKRTKDAFGGVRERNRRARAVQSLPHPAQTEVPPLRLARMLQALASVLQVDQWTQDSLSMRSELRRETPELVFYWFGPDPETYGYNFKLLTAAYPVRHVFNCAVDTFRSTFKETLTQLTASSSSSSSSSSASTSAPGAAASSSSSSSASSLAAPLLPAALAPSSTSRSKA